jgi:dihydrofolate reductase
MGERMDVNMRKISVFIHVSLDGFFAGPNDEIDWFKVIKKDPEWEKHTYRESHSGNTLLFGERTYKMMKSYWPTAAGIQSDPHIAKVLNESPRIVVSKTSDSVKDEGNWKNVTIIRDLNNDTITKLKEERGGTGAITILGSGSIIQQLANMGFIDEYELVVVPIILGEGKYLFKDVKMTEMDLVESRSFQNGLVSLRYQPAR